MTTIDELLTQRRRGALSEADERRLQMAVQTSPEHQLTLLAGVVFDRGGAPQSYDAALIKHIVRQVEGEWSGTFQRVVTRRRLSRWVSVPVLIAGVAAASFGGYRALQLAGVPSSASVHGRRGGDVLALNAPVKAAPEMALAAPPAPQAAPVFAAPSALAQAPGLAPSLAQSPSLAPGASEPAPAAAIAAAESPAAPISPAHAAPIAAVVPAPSAPAGAHTSATWNLPKPRALRRQASAHLETDVAAVLPLPGGTSAPGSASAAEADGPDLESAPVLFRRASELRQSDWNGAAALYERLALRHTESREAGVAEMALGKHALAEGKALKAVQWFEAYQRREGGELVAEAIWGEARAQQSLGEMARARELWTRLIEQYPASAYAAAAREQLGP